MKKRLNNLLNVTLCFLMIISMFSPLSIKADGEWTLTITTPSQSPYELSTTDSKRITVTKDTVPNLLELRKNGVDISDDVTVACASTSSCTFTIPAQHPSVELTYPGSAFLIKNGTDVINAGGQVYSEYASTYNLTVNEIPTLVYEFTADDSYTLEAGTNKIVASKNNESSDIMFSNGGGQAIVSGLTINCDTTTHCSATITGQSGAKISYTSSKLSLMLNPNNGDPYVYNGNDVLTNNENFTVKNPSSNNNEQNQNNNTNPDDPESFDGKAVLVWSCGEKICYHEFTNLNTGNRVFFETAESIADDTDASIKFDVHAKTKFFAPKAKFDSVKSQIDANTIKIDSLVGQDGIDYQPVGEPEENNAYVSYGDRNFKFIIYGTKFNALTIGDLSGLTYYPSAWKNDLTRRESFDLSDTTKSNPVVFDTVLLESKLNLKKIDVNGFTVKSIKPLDVPDGVVTVTKKNDGSFDIDFASRFYNKVVFELTDNSNNKYYFKINRQAMDTKLDITKQKGVLTSDFYFNRSNSWKDYSLNAKILYKDGTSKIVEMTNAKKICDTLGNCLNIYENDEENPSNNDWPVGKGLKRAVFKYDFTKEELKKIDKIYINVEFKGSTSTTYAGNYAGSGKGEVINLSDREYQERLS